MLDATETLVEGNSQAGIYTNESGSLGVIFKGDRIDLFGADINAARKVLAEKRGN